MNTNTNTDPSRDFDRLEPGRKVYTGSPPREWEVLRCHRPPGEPRRVDSVSTVDPATRRPGPILWRGNCYPTEADARAASPKAESEGTR